ncbi:MAG: anhydro-N-acetylmuramic acid kinase [Undibacterium sp.]|nr:anhydro-N-acetylmuramic acid kinase [Undibacterium sp.]
MNSRSSAYIGLMSGTSLDGVDGVLVQFSDALDLPEAPLKMLASCHLPFTTEFKQQAHDLQQVGDNELHREALLANALTNTYATCVAKLREHHPDISICAIGAHGQTLRHRPELGYTLQSNNPALLAELTGIDVIADFRSRDVAAGGQGAPLVPAFHRAMFGVAGTCRVVVNIGGISNISVLHANGATTGFDTGPGNVLMDGWIQKHQQMAYDDGGTWAAQGRCHEGLLAALCTEPYLKQTPPKSTGRDLFHSAWLLHKLNGFSALSPVDVQATLCQFTAITIVTAISDFAPDCQEVFVCGGGAYNAHLMQNIQQLMLHTAVASTASLGMAPEKVEALAFAWLAQRFTLRLAGNLAAVTGASGERILGALFPA